MTGKGSGTSVVKLAGRPIRGKNGFGADEAQSIVTLGVRVVGDPAEITVDAFAGHDVRDMFDCCLVGLPVGTGGVRVRPAASPV